MNTKKQALEDGQPPELRIELLGNFRVFVSGRVVEDAAWQRRHTRLLMKLLALSPQHRMHRDVVLEQLWPDVAPARSSNNLNKILHIARRALEPELTSGGLSLFLHRSVDSIALVSPGELLVDVEHFESKAAYAISHPDLHCLRECASQYTGNLLIDDAFDDQFFDRRESLIRLYRRVLLSLADLSEAENILDESINALCTLVHTDPLNEDYHRRLMRLYVCNNQRSSAVSQFQLCTEVLKAELNESPHDETLALFREITSTSSSRVQSSEQNTAQRRARVDPPAESARTQPQRELLAVFPFDNTAGNDELDYLCDGITENLIYCLSRLPDQQVLARSTVFRYKNKVVDPAQIVTELPIRQAVLGRVSCHHDRIRVWVELVRTPDGLLQWAQHYDRTMKDIIHLQNEIAADMLAFFQSSSVAGSSSATTEHLIVNASAYHLYLKGRYHWNKRTGSALETALAYFHSAIEHDPVYALSYAGLADTYNLISLYTSISPHLTMPKACAAAKQALAINGRLCEGYTSLAYYQLSYEWDFECAEASFQQALRLNPGYATTHQWYHKLLVASGRFDEARTQIEMAKQLDPLSLMIATEEAWGLYHSRRFDDVVRHVHEVLIDDPQFHMAHYILGLAYLHQANFEAAIENLDAAADQQRHASPFLLPMGALGHALALSGNTKGADSLLNRLYTLEVSNGNAAYAKALIHTGLGHRDEALDFLEEAIEERLDRLIFLLVEPLFDTLQELPRWATLASQLPHAPSD